MPYQVLLAHSTFASPFLSSVWLGTSVWAASVWWALQDAVHSFENWTRCRPISETLAQPEINREMKHVGEVERSADETWKALPLNHGLVLYEPCGVGWYFSSSLTGALLLNAIFSLEITHWASCTRRVRNIGKKKKKRIPVTSWAGSHLIRREMERRPEKTQGLPCAKWPQVKICIPVSFGQIWVEFHNPAKNVPTCYSCWVQCPFACEEVQETPWKKSVGIFTSWKSNKKPQPIKKCPTGFQFQSPSQSCCPLEFVVARAWKSLKCDLLSISALDLHVILVHVWNWSLHWAVQGGGHTRQLRAGAELRNAEWGTTAKAWRRLGGF